ncbi:hypothetical protein C8R42DRAFT_656191, partial [Lentinula raphanica]
MLCMFLPSFLVGFCSIFPLGWTLMPLVRHLSYNHRHTGKLKRSERSRTQAEVGFMPAWGRLIIDPRVYGVDPVGGSTN